MPVAALRPFRHKRFSLIWAGSLVSNIGTWMQTVAVGALVTDLTRNALWTALVFIASFLPNGVLAPVGGALADRLDRRRFAMSSVAVEATLAATLAGVVAAGNTNPFVITGIVFLGGCVSALRMPFQQAMLPDLVPREDMIGAISLGSTQWNLGRVLGPVFATSVIVVWSFPAAFAVNAASYLAVLVAFVFVRVPSPERGGAERGLLADMRAGASAVRHHPALRAAVGLIAVAAAFVAPFIALVAAVAAELVDGGGKEIARATGALVTAQGIGAVVASLVFPSLVERFGRRRMLATVLVFTPLAVVPYALAPTLPAAVVGILVVGGSYICILSGLSAVVQLRAPAEFRGRVLSLYFATLSVVFPLGALVQGAVAERIGMRTTTVAGALLMLAVLAALRVWRPGVLEALDDAPPKARSEAAVVTDAAPAQAAN